MYTSDPHPIYSATSSQLGLRLALPLPLLCLRPQHLARVDEAVKLLCGDVAAGEGLLAQGGAAGVGGLCDLGGGVVADGRGQGGDEHEGAGEGGLDVVLARAHVGEAVVGEADGGVGEELDRLQEVVGHERVVDVELKVALAASHGDGGVVAHDLHADHGEGLALRRVDLAGHDGGAGLVLGQRQLAEAGARAGAEEPDVVGNLENGCCRSVDGSVRHDHRVMRRQSLKLVWRRREGQPRDACDAGGDEVGEACGRVEAGADGGAALGELHEVREGGLDAAEGVGDLGGVAGELLAEGERGGVLGVCAANLDDVGPGARLGVKGGMHVAEGRQEAVVDLLGAGNVHGGRVCVVGGLAHVDVVVRVDRLLGAEHAAEHLNRAVRHHLVGVHVRLRAGPRLPDGEREVRVQLAVHDLLRRGHNRPAQRRVELAQRRIGLGRRPLHHAERPHHGLRLLLPANAEVLQRPLRLCAPVAIAGHLDGAERVGLDPHCSAAAVAVVVVRGHAVLLSFGLGRWWWWC
eukprot:m.127581 g.127581  ORF g.127581 m.127581 type:complete len:519 (+) comp16367_c6_seq3:176-1732(+)